MSSVRTRRWTRLEYERLIDAAFFQPGERLELVGGDLLVREPQGDPHALAIELCGDALRAAFGPGWRVRARARVADYWVVNLVDRVLEVYRHPVPAIDAAFGWRYGSAQSFGPGAVISPLAAPEAGVTVSDLLP